MDDSGAAPPPEPSEVPDVLLAELPELPVVPLVELPPQAESTSIATNIRDPTIRDILFSRNKQNHSLKPFLNYKT